MDAWKFFTIENIAATTGIRGQAYKKWFEFVRRFILIDTNYETNNMHKISNTYTCNFLGNAPLSIEWVAP